MDSLLLRQGLFDREYYLRRYDDVREAGADPLAHYVLHGEREGRQPNDWFAPHAYLEANPDVALSGDDPLLHYARRGRREGRPLRPGMSGRPSRAQGALEAARRFLIGALRPLVRPRYRLCPFGWDGRADGVLLFPTGRHLPTGWAIVRVATESPRPLTLCIEVDGVLRHIDLLPTPGGEQARLVHLPPEPGRFELRRGVAQGAYPAPMPREVVLREIGAAEAIVRALILEGSPWRHAVAIARTGSWAATTDRLREERTPQPRARTSGYEEWVSRYDRPTAAQCLVMAARARALGGPVFSVLVPAFNTPAEPLREMIRSVRHQIWPHWELCIADDASTEPHVRAILTAAAKADRRIRVTLRAQNGNISAATNSALALASGPFVALLDHDDVLAPHALLTMAQAIADHPDADLLYSDEDKLDADGRRYGPYFKPDYSPELLQGQNFISHLGVYRTDLLRAIGGFRLGYEGSQDYDVALRVAAATRGPIVHVPHVLYHWRMYPGAETFSSTQMQRATGAARRAIAEQMATLGERVTVTDGVANFHRVVRPDPARWPLVTAIVPTRDHADMLRVCLEGLLDRTDYPALEVIVVDNDSVEPETHACMATLAARGVRVIAYPGPFNYPAINNLAAAQARGEILLFLNNDISVRAPGWLREMVTHAMRPGTGAVGARLLYPDGTVQHAGVVIGMGGVAGHVHIGAGQEEFGYFGRLLLTQEMSCVTAACMAVPAACFAAVGGFDAANLPVAFNDVDLCLRLREAGYRILWTPYAELTHLESKSRGQDDTPVRMERFRSEVAYMQRRWSHLLGGDPFYNPNLSLGHSTPTPAFPPRVPRPWSVL